VQQYRIDMPCSTVHCASMHHEWHSPQHILSTRHPSYTGRLRVASGLTVSRYVARRRTVGEVFGLIGVFNVDTAGSESIMNLRLSPAMKVLTKQIMPRNGAQPSIGNDVAIRRHWR